MVNFKLIKFKQAIGFFARIYENLTSFLKLEPVIIKIINQNLLIFSAKDSQLMEQIVNFVGISAIVSAGNPLQLIKSRIQTMNELVDRGTIQRKYQGIIDCIKAIRVGEGVKALWKGNSISILRFFPNQKINNEVKNKFRELLPSSAASNIVSGVLGGWTAAATLYPFDTIRIMIATQIKRSSETMKQICRKIKNQGARFLFRGYSSSLLNIALFRGTYFGVFDTLKQHSQTNTEKWISAYIAGLAGGLIVYPTETIRKKRIIATKDGKYLEIFKRTFRKDGIQGFFRGSSLVPFQSVVGAAVLMYFDSKQQKN